MKKIVTEALNPLRNSELNLAIKVDGEIHKKQKTYGQERDIFLKQVGITLLGLQITQS